MTVRIVYSEAPTVEPGYSSTALVVTTDRLIGRDTAGTGSSEEISVGGNLEFTGAGGIQRGALTGDVTAAAGNAATTIANDVVSNAKLRDSGALSVIGRAANSTGDPADISAVAASGAVLRESGSAVGFGTIATAGIGDDQVTYAKIQNVSADSRILGRASGAGVGDVTELTAAQVATICNSTFDHGTLAGLADDDHTQYYLADGTRALNGPLNHDGTTVGLYGAAPTAQAADMVALTDSTGGTANSTLEDVTTGGLADPAKCNNNFADIAVKVNAIRTVLRNIGIMA